MSQRVCFYFVIKHRDLNKLLVDAKNYAKATGQKQIEDPKQSNVNYSTNLSHNLFVTKESEYKCDVIQDEDGFRYLEYSSSTSNLSEDDIYTF